jgi:hypothetical protein
MSVKARRPGGARQVSWCVLTDDDRRFVYSPRFAAAYLLNEGQIANGLLLSLLGLNVSSRASSVSDPAARVELGGVHEKGIASADIEQWARLEPEALSQHLRRWYRLFHKHRRLFTPRDAHRWVGSPSASGWWPGLTLDRIAKLVAITERSAGFSDCYPRALITGALCAIGGLPSSITIGMLAPTRKLHAWCTSEGALVYEPTPRHWWYRPLIEFRSVR